MLFRSAATDNGTETITINSDVNINWSSDKNLTLTAGHSIDVLGGAQIKSTGSGSLIMTSGGAGGITLGDGAALSIGSGNLTLTTDALNVGSTAARATISSNDSGTLNIQTYTNSATIGIGNNSSSTLLLRHDTVLPALQDGFSLIRIGNESGGIVTIANQSGFTFKDNLLIRSGEQISLQYSISTGSGSEAGTITLEAAGNITMAGTATIKTVDKDIVLNANSDAVGYGVISLAGTAAIESNGGDITLSGGTDPILLRAKFSESRIIESFP